MILIYNSFAIVILFGNNILSVYTLYQGMEGFKVVVRFSMDDFFDFISELK